LGPLLKWAGGKRQLLPQIRRYYPEHFDRYIEPFFGSGAVYFDLWQSDRLRDRDAVLIDSNPDLIGCYETVRDQPAAVLDALDDLAAAYARDGRVHYYAVRDERFNPARERRRLADGRIAYTPELAAMLIYLNRTGFNGLFRVNSRGAYNVPAGRYERPNIADRDKVNRVAEALSSQRVQLMLGSFDLAGDLAAPGDFLYIDSPVRPGERHGVVHGVHVDAVHDGRSGAPAADGDDVVGPGCHLLLSNSTAREIIALYETPAARAAGLHAVRVPARRAVNSDATRRGPIDEFLISNLTPAAVKAGR
jgi:DNA adenine methylase